MEIIRICTKNINGEDYKIRFSKIDDSRSASIDAMSLAIIKHETGIIPSYYRGAVSEYMKKEVENIVIKEVIRLPKPQTRPKITINSIIS